MTVATWQRREWTNQETKVGATVGAGLTGGLAVAVGGIGGGIAVQTWSRPEIGE